MHTRITHLFATRHHQGTPLCSTSARACVLAASTGPGHARLVDADGSCHPGQMAWEAELGGSLPTGFCVAHV